MFILNKENYVGNQNTRHQLRKCWKITKIVAVSWSLCIIGGSFPICALARLRAKVEIRSKINQLYNLAVLFGPIAFML